MAGVVVSLGGLILQTQPPFIFGGAAWDHKRVMVGKFPPNVFVTGYKTDPCNDTGHNIFPLVSSICYRSLHQHTTHRQPRACACPDGLFPFRVSGLLHSASDHGLPLATCLAGARRLRNPAWHCRDILLRANDLVKGVPIAARRYGKRNQPHTGGVGLP